MVVMMMLLFGMVSYFLLPGWFPLATLRYAPIPAMVIKANGVDDSALEVYSQRIEAFGQSAVPALLSHLESPDRRHRVSAAAGIYVVRDMIPDEVLLRFAHDSDVSISQWMYACLSKRDFTPAYEPVFIVGVRSSSESIRIDSLACLTKNRVELDDPVIAMLARDASSEVRWRCANYLGVMRNQAHAALVASLIDDANAFVKSQAILAAGRVGGDDLQVVVRRLASDPASDEDVRRWARSALAGWGKMP